METKNAIINNYVSVLAETVGTLSRNANNLTPDNIEENKAILRTLNVLLETVRAHVVNIQNSIDTYGD